MGSGDANLVKRWLNGGLWSRWKMGFHQLRLLTGIVMTMEMRVCCLPFSMLYFFISFEVFFWFLKDAACQFWCLLHTFYSFKIFWSSGGFLKLHIWGMSFRILVLSWGKLHHSLDRLAVACNSLIMDLPASTVFLFDKRLSGIIVYLFWINISFLFWCKSSEYEHLRVWVLLIVV